MWRKISGSVLVRSPLSAALKHSANKSNVGDQRARIFIGAISCRCASNGTSGRASKMLIKTMQQAKRYLKIVAGFTLLILGIAMIVTPGPGWLTILLALGVLAAEFVWARRLLDRIKEQGVRIRETVFQRTGRA
jgi:uncharacterized membrane protein